MAAVKDRFGDWLRDTSGATAIEYSLIAAGIALAVALTIFGLGDTLYEMMYSRLPEAFS